MSSETDTQLSSVQFGWKDYKQLFDHFIPCKANYTEKDYDNLEGKVFIVTGGGTGIGYHVSKFLTSHNAKVYIAARNKQKIEDSIVKLKEEVPNAKLDSFLVDFNDLKTIKEGAKDFLSKETLLHGVIHNAGVMIPPEGSRTKQDYDMQLGVNCVGPFLLQMYLDDILIQTAAVSPPNSVRIVWVSSEGHNYANVPGGVYWDDINFVGKHKDATPWQRYGQSKSINIYLAYLWAKKHPGSGVVSLSAHPGHLKSELQRHIGSIQNALISVMLYDAKYGAYTELFAALNPSLTTENNGDYIIPWGKVGFARRDVVNHMKGESGEKIWTWLEDQVAPYF